MDENIEKIKGLLYGLNKAQRRRWYVLILMDNRNLTFDAIATKHRMATWTLAAAVNGKAPWSPRITRALEAALRVDLAGFLTETEAGKLIDIKR